MQKPTLVLIIILSMCSNLFCQSKPEKEQEDLPTVVTAIIIFHADWCSPCQQMKNNVWPNKKVQDLIKKNKYEIFHVNIDTNQKLKNTYGVKSIPAIFILRYEKKAIHKGVILKSNVGYMNVNQLCSFLTTERKSNEINNMFFRSGLINRNVFWSTVRIYQNRSNRSKRR